MWLNVGVYLLVTSLTAVLLNLLQNPLGIAPVVIQIVQFSPALGVAAVVVLRWRNPGLRRAARPSVRWGNGALARVAVAAGLYAVMLAAALWVYAGVFGGEVRPADPGGFGFPVLLIVVAQFLGACGEEAGWRCHLQPELQARFGVLPAAVAVGLLWGAWHVHVFVQEPMAVAGFFLMTVSSSVVLAVLLQRDRTGDLWVSGLMHTLMNLGLLFFLPDAVTNGPQIMSMAVPFVLTAVVASVVSRRRPVAAL